MRFLPLPQVVRTYREIGGENDTSTNTPYILF